MGTEVVIKINPEVDAGFISLYSEVQRLLDYATALTITSNEDVKRVTNDLSLLAKLRKAIEEKRTEYTGPINEQLHLINAAFKTITEPLESAWKITRDKVKAFNDEQKLIQQKQEEINRLRMEAAQKEAAMNQGEIKEPINLVDVVNVPKRVVTDMGSAGMRDNWTYEVTDFALLPDAYKLPNTSALNALAKSVKNTRTIPGVRIWNEPVLTVRPK